VRLPGGERAIIDPEKLRDYVLSRVHPVGGLNGACFASLGYEIDNWQGPRPTTAAVYRADGRDGGNRQRRTGGQVLLMEDTFGKGHASRVLGDEYMLSMIVSLE
jgi:hypothetical protein